MDDQDVANLVGGIALAIMLPIVAWLIVSPNFGSSDGPDQARLSGELSSGTPHRQPQGPPDQISSPRRPHVAAC